MWLQRLIEENKNMTKFPGSRAAFLVNYPTIVWLTAMQWTRIRSQRCLVTKSNRSGLRLCTKSTKQRLVLLYLSIFFQFSVQKMSELLKHSVVEFTQVIGHNWLAFETWYNSSLTHCIIKVLTVSSKEIALFCTKLQQIPRLTSCNNQHVVRLNYLLRRIEVVRIAKFQLHRYGRNMSYHILTSSVITDWTDAGQLWAGSWKEE